MTDVSCLLLCVFCCRLVCEAEMQVTRAQLAHVITEIARITPLTPDGNRTQSWPIGMFSTVNVSFTPVLRDAVREQWLLCWIWLSPRQCCSRSKWQCLGWDRRSVTEHSPLLHPMLGIRCQLMLNSRLTASFRSKEIEELLLQFYLCLECAIILTLWASRMSPCSYCWPDVRRLLSSVCCSSHGHISKTKQDRSIVSAEHC